MLDCLIFVPRLKVTCTACPGLYNFRIRLKSLHVPNLAA